MKFVDDDDDDGACTVLVIFRAFLYLIMTYDLVTVITIKLSWRIMSLRAAVNFSYQAQSSRSNFGIHRKLITSGFITTRVYNKLRQFRIGSFSFFFADKRTDSRLERITKTIRASYSVDGAQIITTGSLHGREQCMRQRGLHIGSLLWVQCLMVYAYSRAPHCCVICPVCPQ